MLIKRDYFNNYRGIPILFRTIAFKMSDDRETFQDDSSDAFSGRTPDARTNLKKEDDGYVGVIDLSDENRPTKLVERYSELYVKQWMDAYDEIQKRLSQQFDDDTAERETISILLQTLKDAMQFCESEFHEQDIQLKEALFRDPKLHLELPKAFVEQLKQTKKFLADKTVDAVCKKFLARKSSIKNFPIDKIKEFVKECVKISWLMVNQDPPVVFDVTAKPGDSFDSKKYKEYTSRGPNIDFLVWPPMQIKGRLLYQGVAQGKPEYVKGTNKRLHTKKPAVSKAIFQIGARNFGTDDDMDTVNDRLIFDELKRERRQDVIHEDTRIIKKKYTERQITRRPVSKDPIFTRRWLNDHNGGCLHMNHNLQTRTGRTRDVSDYSGRNYTSTSDVATLTELSPVVETAFSVVHQTHDDTNSTMRGYREKYPSSTPIKADIYEYGRQRYRDTDNGTTRRPIITDDGRRNTGRYKSEILRPKTSSSCGFVPISASQEYCHETDLRHYFN